MKHNPFHVLCKTYMFCAFGWQGTGSWSQQSLRPFCWLSGSLNSVWFDSMLHLWHAAAFRSTQTSPWWGETLKWPLKLHCNQTQPKNNKKMSAICLKALCLCLSETSGDYWQGWMMWGLDKEAEWRWLLLPVSMIRSVRATQLSVSLLFDKCLMQHRP